MPRSLWNGTLAFGLVRVPVKLYSATESRRIAFRERHVTDAAAIEHRRVCVKEGKEVPYEEIIKGFELANGSYVVLSKEDVASADGPQAHVVEVEHFVDGKEIDPIYYERGYYLGPGKLGDEAYLVLHQALARSGRVGIGRFVFHNKAHLVAIRALERVIGLSTMRFADELAPTDDLELPAAQKQPTKLEVDTAKLLVEQLEASFEPDRYKDTYRDAVMALIERKARGEAIELGETQPAGGSGGDLLDALRASLKEHGRAPRHGGGSRARKKAPTAARAGTAHARARGDR